ncbi:hypothetical protein MHI27_09780 [Paenibacillus sp. FSL H8-0261]
MQLQIFADFQARSWTRGKRCEEGQQRYGDELMVELIVNAF